MKNSRLQIPTIVLAVVALVVGVSSGAVAAKLITGKDVKDNSLTTKDIKNGTLTTKDIKKNGVKGDRLKKGSVSGDRLKNGAVTSKQIKDGTISSGDLSSSTKNSLKTTYAGENWSIVDRNVQGNGDSALRAGPSFRAPDGSFETKPPFGIGSLGMRVGATSDKASFGNQVNFGGIALSTFTTLSYWVFTPSGAVSPNLQLEIDPNLSSNATNFTTLSYENEGVTAGAWTKIDAMTTTRQGWGMSGAAGTATGCTLTTPCTWAEVMAALAADNNGTPAAVSFSVQFNLGSGAQALSAAVDGLQINNDIYNFEPFGVSVSHP